MDTSDGAIPTLDELMRLNDVGIDIELEAEASLDAPSRAVARRAGLPGWMLLAGPHGEFELIFSVPDGRVRGFLEAAHRIDWRPIRLGRVVETPGLCLPVEGRRRRLDTTVVRNLFNDEAGNPADYLGALEAVHRRMVGGAEAVAAGNPGSLRGAA